MAMDLLQRIEEASFPLALHAEHDIHRATVLATAQFIEATLPPATGNPDGQVAIVLRITPLGRAELIRLKRDSSGSV
jgi:hypothetical protein